jgi:hypothetical protein
MKKLFAGGASVALAALLFAGSAAADPPAFYQRDVRAADHNNSVPLAVDAPHGVLGKLSNSSEQDGCPAGGTFWKYDSASYEAGDSFDLTGWFSSYYTSLKFTESLHLPPTTPFSFTGTLDDRACSTQTIAFVAPSENTYHLTFGLNSGSFAYSLDNDDESRVNAPLSHAFVLRAGVHTIRIDDPIGQHGTWQISGTDDPPIIEHPQQQRTAATAGTSTAFSVALSESGNVHVDVLQGSRVVRELVRSLPREAGGFRFTWDGRLANGAPAPLGLYTLRVTETDWANRTVSHDFPYRLVLPDPQEQAASGAVRALLYYKKTNSIPFFKAMRVVIEREGVVLLDKQYPDDWTSPGGFGEQQSVNVRDLDNDSVPEVILDLYSGGAHCCSSSTVFRYIASSNRYAAVTHQWGNHGYRIQALHHDQRLFWVSADDRFAYALDACYACSGFPTQIWTYNKGKFTEVTRKFPAQIKADTARWWRAYHSSLRSNYEATGPLSAWAADMCLLNQCRTAHKRLNSLAMPPSTNGEYTRTQVTTKFVRQLISFLRKTGYWRT